MACALRLLVVPVSTGMALGIAGAIALARYLRQMLFGISSLDPTSYVFAIGLFPVAVLAAAVLPARQALGIDVVQALRRD